MTPQRSLRDRLGLGGVAIERTFATFDAKAQPKAYQVATAFLDNPRSIVFSGPNGIGKTHLAMAVGNALLEKQGWLAEVWFIHFGDALRKLRATYQTGYDGFGEEWWLKSWREIPVLILDDVGQAGLKEPSEFTRKIGYDIIDGRYRAGNRPIILTTNKAPGQLGDWITESAVSRLYEMGDVVLMKGKDWRLKRG